MTSLKEKRRLGKKNLREAREILFYMEKLLISKEEKAVNMATAFFTVLHHHLNDGDLKPADVHLTALLREGL